MLAADQLQKQIGHQLSTARHNRLLSRSLTPAFLKHFVVDEKIAESSRVRDTDLIRGGGHDSGGRV